ncbi:sensor histidine kinase [Ramlibacter albus]|uniref:histidine kinase n=1 Tax=Ramlibacter albus TaxID=2079448 RepID=A0A923MAA1_9BURK|nr:ATP-binding protein [Ramlibacter albus]MBC5766255.1 PAS domain S-box protein [Ramlibacter albus]
MKNDPKAWQAGLELVFRHAATGVAFVAPDGRILRANGALCDMIGYSETELLDMTVARMLHDDEVQADEASRATLLAGAQGPERREVRMRHKRGRSVWAQVTRVLARGPQGEPAFFVDEVQDLTERRRAEKEIVLLNNLLEQRIRRRTRELEESNEDLREFAYSIAHDLRGPLGSIDGFSARLQELLGDRLGERESHYLRRVRAGVQTMAELTDGLLALADISRAELARSSVDLSALASGILERLREQHPERAVRVDVSPTPPAVGDPRLLGNVMENLVGNAWKFSARNPSACISFGSEVGDDGLRYFVRDNGAGFDAEHAGKLFTPFQRLHSVGEFAGNGIGLALVRKIVGRHGGQVWAQSRPGEGATFWFTLAS